MVAGNMVGQVPTHIAPIYLPSPIMLHTVIQSLQLSIQQDRRNNLADWLLKVKPTAAKYSGPRFQRCFEQPGNHKNSISPGRSC